MGLAGGAIASAAVVTLEACGSSGPKTRTSSIITTTPGPDAPILNHALDLEHMAITAYTASAPLLSGTAHLAAQRFLSQELAHAGEIAGLVHQAGGKPVKPKRSYDLGNPRTTTDVLQLLYAVEQAQIAAYVEAVPLLSEGSSRAAVAAILANEAQHASILLLALGRSPVPGAFVRAGK